MSEISTCASILSVHLLIHIVASLYSHSLYKRSGQGLNPDSLGLNLAVTLTLLGCLSALVYVQKKAIAGSIATVLFAHSVFNLIRYVIEYFRYKGRLRMARQVMKETGEKSDLTIQGYSSLNTLMLSVLITIYGLFALGAVCYATLVSHPTSIDDANLSFDQLQQLYKLKT